MNVFSTLPDPVIVKRGLAQVSKAADELLSLNLGSTKFDPAVSGQARASLLARFYVRAVRKELAGTPASLAPSEALAVAPAVTDKPEIRRTRSHRRL